MYTYSSPARTSELQIRRRKRKNACDSVYASVTKYICVYTLLCIRKYSLDVSFFFLPPDFLLRTTMRARGPRRRRRPTTAVTRRRVWRPHHTAPIYTYAHVYTHGTQHSALRSVRTHAKGKEKRVHTPRSSLDSRIYIRERLGYSLVAHVCVHVCTHT